MKRLVEILPEHTEFGIVGSRETVVQGFSFDSRKASPEIAFVARRGHQLDGHDFIKDALSRGCRAVCCENLPEQLAEGVSYIYSANLTACLGEMLHRFYDNSFEKIHLVGVTGTNGKTTVASLLYALYTSMGYRCGLISTVENIIHTEKQIATHTTPDQIALYDLLNQMVQKQCSHVFMEVSSHAIDQGRIEGLNFEVAIFTNVTHDHLDYHGTFKNYIYTKKKFFDNLNERSFAIVNVDDPNGSVMLQNTRAQKQTYGIRTFAAHKAKILGNGMEGLHLKFDPYEWHSKLMGEFNAYNLLAVYVTALCLGGEPVQVLAYMSALEPVRGRMECLRNNKTGKMAVVDYAHTPDALMKILENLNALRKAGQKLITVVGCGGNRDKAKRPIMAHIACTYSDKAILTSDNPRDEEPGAILHEMEEGVKEEFKGKYVLIEDRLQAIKTACMMADRGDLIIVAGKGHENYQEVKGEKLPFDDKEILNTFL